MLYAPAATPADVISLLNGELNKIVGDSALKARFASIGYDPTALTPDAAAAIMRKTGEVWAPLIKRLNIKLTAAGLAQAILAPADSCLYKPGHLTRGPWPYSRPVAHSDR
jgi:hypothetical protein